MLYQIGCVHIRNSVDKRVHTHSTLILALENYSDDEYLHFAGMVSKTDQAPLNFVQSCGSK